MEKALQVLTKSELLGHQFTIYGTADSPLFMAKEVADVIDHSKADVMVNMVDDDEKVKVNNFYISGRTGGNGVWMLTEDGLYEVLMQSRKPIAKQFKKGIKAILKEIRKTGGYIAASPDDTPEMIMAKALKVADATMRRQDTELRAAKGTLAAIKEAIRESTAALEKANRLLYGEPEEAKAEPKEAEPVEKRREFAPEISLIDPDEYRGYRWRYDGLWGAYDLLVKFAHKSYFHVDDFFDTLVRAGYAIETSYVGGDCKRRRCYRLTEEGKRWGRNKLFHATGKSLPIFYHDRFERFLDELKRKGFKI